MAITGKLGGVFLSDGTPSTTFTDQPTVKNATFTEYAVANTAFDKYSPVTVKKNDVIITTGFTIEHAGGVIRFAPALLGTDVIKVSGKKLTLAQCAGLFNWKLDYDVDLKEIPMFGNDGWVDSVVGMKGASVSADGYWADDVFIEQQGKEVVVVLYVDTTKAQKYAGYMILGKLSVDTPTEDVVKENLEFKGNGIMAYQEV